MIKIGSYLNETIVPEHYLGYYSASGVCLPQIFQNPDSDHPWEFSLLTVIINFIAFLYVALAYVIIYK